MRPVPLTEGFDAIEGYLGGIGRPPAALCACELRSPAESPTPGSSRSIDTMSSGWPPGGSSTTPTTICCRVEPLAGKSTCSANPLDLFLDASNSYTVPDANSTARSFVAAGSGEARDGGPSYQERIIRRGDQSPEAMREKARFVLRAMEQRMTALGFGWAEVTATQVYTIFDIHPLLPDEIVRRGASPGGLTWHFARPPVQGLDFEVDVRAVGHERVI